MTSRKLLVLIIPLILFNGTALAISEATFLFLAIPPSPQANGMAGVYTSMGNDDPLAPLSVPSVIGLMGERTQSSSSILSERRRAYSPILHRRHNLQLAQAFLSVSIATGFGNISGGILRSVSA